MRDLPINFVRVDYCVDAFFLVDIIITFFVAYLDRSTYVLVDEKSKIALRYFQESEITYCSMFLCSAFCRREHESL
jgi:hypothetical protein